MYDNLPRDLKNNAMFCLWKYADRGGKKTKLPFQIDGSPAKSNDKSCFCDFDTAVKNMNDYDGIGMGIFDGYSAVDIDHCVENGVISDMALDIIKTLRSYTEISPSKTGIRIIFKADDIAFDKAKYYINNRNLGLEIYISGVTNKYVTLTGNEYKIRYFVRDCSREIMTVLDKYMLKPKEKIEVKTNIDTLGSRLSDEQVLEKAMNAKNGYKFLSLWKGEISNSKSHSEADMSLAMLLAFWCRGDIEQMDRIFRRSGLMRDKWNEMRGNVTYGQMTLENAVNRSANFYNGSNSYFYDELFDDELAIFLEKANPVKNYPRNDNGTSRLFAEYIKDELRFVPERKCWYYYNGICWSADKSDMVIRERCKQFCAALLKEVADKVETKEQLRYYSQIQNKKPRDNIIKDAQSVYPISLSEFDSDKYLFNCINGTLDLKQMEFRKHNADDRITKLASVKYDPKARSERFCAFIDQIMCEDKDAEIFLQKALGYALTGDTRYECLFILYGATTRNGKGTLMESVLNLMGDYGLAVNPESLANKRTNGSAPSEDIARLAGARFANISEPGKSMVFNSALVKTLTGNDTINARYLHENSFDFKPQFKIYINTNYLPTITDMTVFSSNRIYTIPFERHFEEWEQDKNLKDEFQKNETKSAILNWLLDGYKMLTEQGLTSCSKVQNATAKYREESDKFSEFISDCLERDVNSKVKTADVYRKYREWCNENGYCVENSRNLNQALRAYGEIKKCRDKTDKTVTNMFVGYKIISDFF